MHAASRHGIPSLTSLPKNGGVSCFGRSSGTVADRAQLCSPRKVTYIITIIYVSVIRNTSKRENIKRQSVCKRILTDMLKNLMRKSEELVINISPVIFIDRTSPFCLENFFASLNS